MTDRAPHFTELIAAAAKVAPYARDLADRVPTIQLGIVDDVNDPLNQRRITVTLTSKAGKFSTNWLPRCQVIPYSDPPLPKPTTQVLVLFVNGDPHNGYWLGPIHNDLNPSDSAQKSPVNDSSAGIPGNDNVAVVGDRTRTTHGNQLHDIRGDSSTKVKGAIDSLSDEEQWFRSEKNTIIEAGKQLRLQNDSSVAVQLTETGDLILQSVGGKISLTKAGVLSIATRLGHKFTFDIGGLSNFDLAGGSLNIINAGTVKINGKEVTTVGALDSRSDTLTTRGY